MRLTLRTLLAWLDDTLPPAEVRQIGQQFSDSPFAQDLVEKIQRVTRQRRLIVPEDSGPGATDPNQVSAYLDNELEPERVADYEKLCLTSDVNLAEVASSHQILSLLAQKAKVPAQARQRMYHLVRGREASPAPTPRSEPVVKLESPVVVPVWTPPQTRQRSLAERFGPLAAVASLILLLCWSAWMSASPTSKLVKPTILAQADQKIPDAPPLREVKEPADRPNPMKPTPEGPVETPRARDNTPDTERPDVGTPDAGKPVTPEVEKPPALPEGAVAVLGASDGVTFRHNPDSRAWERLASGASLRAGDRIINLAPFSSPLQIGASRATLVGDAEIRLLAEVDGVPHLEMLRGRVKLEAPGTSRNVVVGFGGSTLELGLPPGSIVGLERAEGARSGPASPLMPQLRVIAGQGEAKAKAGSKSETLAAGSALLFQVPETLTQEPPGAPLAWVTETGPTVAEEMSGKAFAAYFKPDKPTMLCLVEAAEDEAPEIRQLAIRAMGSIAPVDLIVGTMSRKGDPASRQAAIAVLRRIHLLDEAASRALHEGLVQSGGSEEWASKVEEMLVGYSAREAADPATGAKLVNLLKETEDVGVRELAIMNLQLISRRGDRLGYDPDRPTENGGLKAWQDLVQRSELRLPPAPKLR